MIKIQLKSHNIPPFQINVNTNLTLTVEDLKHIVSEYSGYPTTYIKLLHKGKILREQTNLSTLNLVSCDHMHALFRPNQLYPPNWQNIMGIVPAMGSNDGIKIGGDGPLKQQQSSKSITSSQMIANIQNDPEMQQIIKKNPQSKIGLLEIKQFYEILESHKKKTSNNAETPESPPPASQQNMETELQVLSSIGYTNRNRNIKILEQTGGNMVATVELLMKQDKQGDLFDESKCI